MTDPDRDKRLEEATRATLERLSRRRQALAARLGGPRPGDVYLFEDLSVTAREASLFWVLVLAHPDDPRSFLAVPADDNPLRGGDDVAVPESEGSGPLTMRCGLSTWIGAAHVTPARLDGWVDASAVAAARTALRDIAAGRRRGGFAAREVEATAEYEDWLGVVAAAEVALSEQLEALDRAAAEPPAGRPKTAVSWGPKPARASTGDARWPDVDLELEDGSSFRLVEGVTDLARGTTSFRLLQFTGARAPIPRLVLWFLDGDGQVLAITGAPEGVVPGRAFEVEGLDSPRAVATIAVRRLDPT